jgi:hypothetical protein
MIARLPAKNDIDARENQLELAFGELSNFFGQ